MKKSHWRISSKEYHNQISIFKRSFWQPWGERTGRGQKYRQGNESGDCWRDPRREWQWPNTAALRVEGCIGTEKRPSALDLFPDLRESEREKESSTTPGLQAWMCTRISQPTFESIRNNDTALNFSKTYRHRGTGFLRQYGYTITKKNQTLKFTARNKPELKKFLSNMLMSE